MDGLLGKRLSASPARQAAHATAYGCRNECGGRLFSSSRLAAAFPRSGAQENQRDIAKLLTGHAECKDRAWIS